jgi:hypothetical protein
MVLSWVNCFNCFKKIEKEDALERDNVYFCHIDCLNSFYERLKQQQQEAEEESNEK